MDGIIEFIEARLVEREEEFHGLGIILEDTWLWESAERFERQLQSETQAFRQMLEIYKQWPVILETPANVTSAVDDFDYQTNQFSTEAITMKLSRKVDFLTTKAYIERFGWEPPVAPMMRAVASVWRDHPDFKQEWS